MLKNIKNSTSFEDLALTYWLLKLKRITLSLKMKKKRQNQAKKQVFWCGFGDFTWKKKFLRRNVPVLIDYMYEEEKKKRNLAQSAIYIFISLVQGACVCIYIYTHAPCTKVNGCESIRFVFEKFVLSLRPDFSTTKGSHMQTKWRCSFNPKSYPLRLKNFLICCLTMG